MRRAGLAGALIACCLGVAVAAASPPPAAAARGFTVTTLDFHVRVANEGLLGDGAQRCTIVGDLYRPAGASHRHPVPAVLTTNGFGGSKNDQAGVARVLAAHGYGVLSYSGLGFGGSGCKVSLDDPSTDGRAGSQLVSFLGGQAGIATRLDGRAFPPVRWVIHDRRDHAGRHAAHDPRVGMIGGSYGGEIQFAIADRDPRLDAIIPIITWNDLSYSLIPNDTGFRRGVTASAREPGVAKLEWALLFFADGVVDGLQGVKVDPSRDVGCPNFVTEACLALAEVGSNVTAGNDVYHFLRHASVASYLSRIRVPTLLAQGQADTLFNLQEAVATYRALRRQHTPVKMIWQSWGHSDGTPARGEYDGGAAFASTYEGQRFLAWFDHYLKGERVSTGPRFAYYRDWVPFHGDGADTVQYGTARRYPAGRTTTLFASGGSRLVADRRQVTRGSQTYANLAGPAPLSYSEVSGVQGSPLPNKTFKPFDTPGSFARWKSAPLRRHLDVVGIPTATVHVSSPLTSSLVAGTELQFFVKIYDLAPNGSVDLVHRLVAPVRVADPRRPVQVELPGIVHRFAKGHRIELVVAATDSAYRNANLVQPATITTSRQAPTSLTLPVTR
ncbi:MAG TPA: CocE/NonD family hydrolase [Mycobacteriales bacterium]|jgi:ABC-2 type transport system ATP-binding protein|nr:CocE/NonD family hydrolase [Mycobacteriales bacterium]